MEGTDRRRAHRYRVQILTALSMMTSTRDLHYMDVGRVFTIFTTVLTAL